MKKGPATKGLDAGVWDLGRVVPVIRLNPTESNRSIFVVLAYGDFAVGHRAASACVALRRDRRAIKLNQIRAC